MLILISNHANISVEIIGTPIVFKFKDRDKQLLKLMLIKE